MIESTCVYLKRNGCWLMLYRNAKKNDVNHGKWIGIGGKREPGESVEACAAREVYEESGFHVRKLNYEGKILFHNPNAEDELIHVFSSDDFNGTMRKCDEGELAWIREEDLMHLSLWDGDRIFMKRMFTKEAPFSYIFTYDMQGNLKDVQEG